MQKNKILNCIFIFIFIVAIIVPMLSWRVIKMYSVNNPKINDIFDYDIGEKRAKATMSEILTIENIAGEIEKYYNDRIPYRSSIITFKKIIDAYIEKPYKEILEKSLMAMMTGKKERVVQVQADMIDGKYVCYMDEAVDVFLNHGLKRNEIDPYIPNIKYPVKYINNTNVFWGQGDWLFLNNANIPYYTGENKEPISEIKKRVKLYEKTKNICEENGKTFTIVVCPEKEEVYSEYMPYLEIKEEKEVPLYVREYIASYSDVVYIYPKEKLIDAKKKYLTYRKYDSHWNSVGGYIAANCIKEVLGMETKPLRDCVIAKIDEFDCTLITYGGGTEQSFKKAFEYLIDYKWDLSHKKIFVDDEKTNESFATCCENDNKRKMFLAGDSFRSAISEFFIKDFNILYCNTFMNFNKNFIKEEIEQATDIVFVVVERNEKIVLPILCNKVCDVLSKKNNEKRTKTK